LHAKLPLTLSRLHAANETQRDAAWADFVREHSDIVLHACKALAQDHDAAMDGYAFVLEALREDECRRLCAYTPDGKTRFTTWLVVVTRRLMLDFLRQRYGRSRSDDTARREEKVARRNLEDLVAAEIDPDQIEGSGGAPDAALRRAELTRALRDAIGQLEPRDRLLLSLKIVDGRPAREIARTLVLPSVFHVYRQLAGALKRLQAELARRGVEGSEP